MSDQMVRLGRMVDEVLSEADALPVAENDAANTLASAQKRQFPPDDTRKQ